MPAKLGMLWSWALIAAVACASIGASSRADGPTTAPAPTVNEVVALVPTECRHRLVQKLSMAEGNRDDLLRAISQAKPEQRDGLAFLIANMPDSDLTLKPDFLTRDVALAYEARQSHPWGATIPDDIFMDAVLPYANLNERRDDWRADFVAKFGPLVKDCKTATEAAQVLNRRVFDILKVKYHATKRRKPDQSPYESAAIGYASCTGLSIILADACRAVGVPARVVGTARWSDDSGNHTWVEIWDGQWWFVGAAEPGALNDTWFGALAAKAEPERPEYRIYAASFRETSDHFPLIWDLNRTDVGGVDVSRYYIKRKKLSINVLGEDGRPADALVSILQDSRTIGRKSGSAPSFEVGTNSDYLIRATAAGDLRAEQSLHFPADSDSAIELKLAKANKAEPAAAPHAAATPAADAADSSQIAALKSWLATPTAQRPDLAAQPFSHADLTKADAAQAQKLVWDDHAADIRATRESDWKNNQVSAAGKTMKFLRKNFGDKPKDGWNLFISMHGGGNAAPSVNDSQWQNQIKLYQPANSLYIAPRAPTDTWNLWHEPHIDALFDQLIQDAIVLEGVNPDRVYIMGYSAGGDGVYQLAPRMADRWAAASMMAGHPNDASPLGLRNIGFTIHVGANDNGYDRNKVAERWKGLLDDLQKSDPEGYVHEVKLHEGRAHWMNLEDKVAVDWMLKFTRNPLPEKIVWKQSTVTHDRFYWLAMPPREAKAAQEVVATRSGQTIDIQQADNVGSLIVLLSDDMLDMDQPVRITMGGVELFAGKVQRAIATISDTIAQRGDPRSVFSGSVTVRPAPPK